MRDDDGAAPGPDPATPGRTTRAEERGLAADLAALARDLEGSDDLEATLRAVVVGAVGAVPGAERASISMVTRRRRTVTTRAASDDVAARLDAAQYEAGEGPCLDALFEQPVVETVDAGRDERWPVLAGAARDLGVGAMLCVRLWVHGDDLGALNISATREAAFEADAVHVAELFATHAAVALVGAEREQQMREALARRDVIGQAMGIVMERFGLASDRAFGVLVRLSQHANRRLHEIAAELVETRTLPVPGDADARRGPRPPASP